MGCDHVHVATSLAEIVLPPEKDNGIRGLVRNYAAPTPPSVRRRRSDKREYTGRHSSMGGRRRTRGSYGLSCLLLLVSVFLPEAVATGRPRQPQVECSKSCVAENCNSVGIRYGKFCGVGWTGCPGEKPCDDLDACCKVHDECVEKKGLMSVRCHEKFKSCIRKVKKSGKVGFSRQCPYETAMPTMTQGMDMAILFSQLGSPKYEL